MFICSSSFTRSVQGSRSYCDTPTEGFQCYPSISHTWGQYSPFYSVQSPIQWKTPKGCKITFAHILSRHGARYPTSKMSEIYNSTIQQIQENVKSLTGHASFLSNYRYDLDIDQLNDFGRREMLLAGIAFHERYRELAGADEPFVRASGSDRVIESAELFMTGYGQAQRAVASSKSRRDAIPSDLDEKQLSRHHILVIPELDSSNNTSVFYLLVSRRSRSPLCSQYLAHFYGSAPTWLLQLLFPSLNMSLRLLSLSHSLCTAFESRPPLQPPTSLSPILTRLSALLPNANLSLSQVEALMDLCPYTTLSSKSTSNLSPFCTLFMPSEWRVYDIEKSRGKYQSFGVGSALGPTQGVGWVNELVARLTGHKVDDDTSTNRTLDSDHATFPLGRKLYADFSHDNVMTSIFFAMGLFNGMAGDMNGFRASETVPFAGRGVVEKMVCGAEEEEMVRVIINGRVMPLEHCGGDPLGRCTLSSFINSLKFAKEGGRWRECFDN